MRRVITIGVATAATAALIISGSAAGAQLDSADTTVTFTLVSGPLLITAPIAAALLQDTAGAPTVTGVIPLVTVTDQRFGSTGWTAAAETTDFVAAPGGPANTITKGNVSYTPSNVVRVAAPGTASNTVSLDAKKDVVTATSITLVTNSVTWTADLSVDVSAASSLNLYTSTLTHSVA